MMNTSGGNPRRASAGSSSNQSSSTHDETNNLSGSFISRPRVRGRDLYQGHVSFGSANSSTTSAALALGGSAASSYLRRSNRLLAATPYFSRDKQSQRQQRRQKANTETTEEPEQQGQVQNQRQMLNSSSNSSEATLSTTAKTILDTLERMSTPVRDAQKIPVPRAERRRQIADDLLSSGGRVISRRRPRLGGGGNSSSLPSTPGFLNGPPLRSNLFAPLPARSPNRNLTRLEPRPPPKSIASSSSTLPTSSSQSNFPPGFFSNAFTSSNSNSSLSSSRTASTVIKEPMSKLPQETGGKLRAKVGERAKARQERKEGDDEEVQVPEYLARAGSNNVFSGMTSLPTFNFASPKKIGSSEPVFGSLTPDRNSRLEEGQRLLTSPDLNPADSPLSGNVLKKRSKFNNDPVSVMKHVFNATPKQLLMTNGQVAVNGDQGQDDPEQDFSFSFQSPEELKQASRSRDFGNLSEINFDFSTPQKLLKC